MIEFITSSPYFSIALTIAMFCLATLINAKWPSLFTTPLLVGTLLVIAILLLLKIPYTSYEGGVKYMSYFLMPITVCFAVSIYKQLDVLKKYIWPILVAVFIGSVSSVLAVSLICILLGLGDIVAKSLASISVTTAIAISITERLGGIVSLTTSAVIVTGVLGASVSALVCRIVGIKSPIAQGLAIGNASHTAGTLKALAMGPIEGTMSSLAIVLSGIMTAIIAPLIIHWLF